MYVFSNRPNRKTKEKKNKFGKKFTQYFFQIYESGVGEKKKTKNLLKKIKNLQLQKCKFYTSHSDSV